MFLMLGAPGCDCLHVIDGCCNAIHCPDSRPYLSSWCSTGTSLQLRVTLGVFSNNANYISFLFNDIP